MPPRTTKLSGSDGSASRLGTSAAQFFAEDVAVTRWASFIALAAIIVLFGFLFYQVMSAFLVPLFVAAVDSVWKPWSAEERAGWSVVVRGVAREVTQWAEREQLENIGLVPWARDAWRPVWVRVDAAEVTGRILR